MPGHDALTGSSRVQLDGLDQAQAGPGSVCALALGDVTSFVLDARSESVCSLAGIDGEALRVCLDQVEPGPDTRRALHLRIAPGATTEAIVEQVIAFMAETALRLWPVWYTDVDFGACRNDSLGRLAASAIIHGAASRDASLMPLWAERAARCALEGRAPRVAGTPAATEMAQLGHAISRTGLVLVTDMGAVADVTCCSEAVVRALEWIARYSGGAVIALFPEIPENQPPFDRILYGARLVAAETLGGPAVPVEVVQPAPWIAPWRGLPHPLSDIEKRLATALMSDAELGSLFGFNQFITTHHGSRPKVDLLWREGRLVVEIDGYESHGNRRAFMDDRHRDYELVLSGYSVLRITNDEIAQDCERTIEKIRSLVHLRRAASH